MMYTRSVPGCLPSPSTGQCLAPRFQFTVRRPTRRKRTSPSRSTDPWTEFKVVTPCELTKHFSVHKNCIKLPQAHQISEICNEFGWIKRPPIIPPRYQCTARRPTCRTRTSPSRSARASGRTRTSASRASASPTCAEAELFESAGPGIWALGSSIYAFATSRFAKFAKGIENGILLTFEKYSGILL